MELFREGKERNTLPHSPILIKDHRLESLQLHVHQTNTFFRIRTFSDALKGYNLTLEADTFLRTIIAASLTFIIINPSSDLINVLPQPKKYSYSSTYRMRQRKRSIRRQSEFIRFLSCLNYRLLILIRSIFCMFFFKL